MEQEIVAERLDVTWGRAATVWWSLVWRATLYSTLAGALLGGLGGVIAALAGRPEAAHGLGLLVGQLVSLPVSLLVVRMVLRKKFSSFCIKLVPA